MQGLRVAKLTVQHFQDTGLHLFLAGHFGKGYRGVILESP